MAKMMEELLNLACTAAAAGEVPVAVFEEDAPSRADEAANDEKVISLEAFRKR